MSESARLADQIRRAFDGEAWHGPALMEILADVDAATAAARPLRIGRNGVDRRVDDDDSQDRILVISPVQLETGTSEVLPVYLNLETPLRVFARGVIPTQALGPWCK